MFVLSSIIERPSGSSRDYLARCQLYPAAAEKFGVLNAHGFESNADQVEKREL